MRGCGALGLLIPEIGRFGGHRTRFASAAGDDTCHRHSAEQQGFVADVVAFASGPSLA